MKNKEVKSILINALVFLVSYILITLGMKVGIISNYWHGILMMCCINIILTVSLNLLSGYLGELTLGHAGFFAIGAYAGAYFTQNMNLVGSVEFPLAILVGGVVTAVFGYIVSIPTLRLKGDYLAIITLAFGEIVRNILTNLKATGAAAGYTGIRGYSTFTWAFVIMAISVLLVRSLIASRQGRDIVAIREDEIAAESMGVNLNKYKQLAFVFAAFLAGVAGVIYAHYMCYIQPSTFTLNKSIEILVMVVLGGMGNIYGSIISACILTALPEVLRFMSDYRMLLYAIVLIVMMIMKYSPAAQNFLARFEHVKKEETSHE